MKKRNTQFLMKITAELKEKIKKRAYEQDKSMTQYIIDLVRKDLSN